MIENLLIWAGIIAVFVAGYFIAERLERRRNSRRAVRQGRFLTVHHHNGVERFEADGSRTFLPCPGKSKE